MLVLWLYVLSFFSPPPSSPLPVPHRLSETRLAGPLALSHIETSVLGTQTIDPVDFVAEINKERQKVGAPPLRMNNVLMQAATMRAAVIKKYQNFSHQDPHEGIELTTVLPKLNYHYVYASENIGMGGLSSADFVNGFMHSTSHRENLLDARLTDTGAAIVDGPYHEYYVNYAVQLFAIPGGQDEFLGYTKSDRDTYERALLSISRSLHPMRLGALKLFKQYNEKKIEGIRKQKQILVTVVSKMQKNIPLENNDVALILQYNTLL